MGLGGTQHVIPASILAIVSNTQVLGAERVHAAPAVDANMALSTAHDPLLGVVPVSRRSAIQSVRSRSPSIHAILHSHPDERGRFDVDSVVQSIEPPPTHCAVVELARGVAWRSLARPRRGVLRSLREDELSEKCTRGRSARSHRERIEGRHLIPWCIRKPISAARLAHLDQFLNDPANQINGQPLPLCPESVAVPLEDETRLCPETLT